jgi:hypothetical protein
LSAPLASCPSVNHRHIFPVLCPLRPTWTARVTASPSLCAGHGAPLSPSATSRAPGAPPSTPKHRRSIATPVRSASTSPPSSVCSQASPPCHTSALKHRYGHGEDRVEVESPMGRREHRHGAHLACTPAKTPRVVRILCMWALAVGRLRAALPQACSTLLSGHKRPNVCYARGLSSVLVQYPFEIRNSLFYFSFSFKLNSNFENFISKHPELQKL